MSAEFPSAHALAVFDGASVTVTYFTHPQAASASAVTGTLIAVNRNGVVVQKADTKHVWIHSGHIVGIEEQ
jgi:hypothetical protein